MRFALLLIAAALHAETGYNAWLRYAPLDHPPALPAVVVVQGDSPVLISARDELIRGVRGMTGRTLRIDAAMPNEPAIVIGTGNLAADAFQSNCIARQFGYVLGNDLYAAYLDGRFSRAMLRHLFLTPLQEPTIPKRACLDLSGAVATR